MKPQYPISKIEGNYNIRFSVAVGVFIGSFLSSWQQGVILSLLMIVIAIFVRMKEEGVIES